jgi:hypothetical protein
VFSISDTAVSGGMTRHISPEARAALDQGNLTELFDLQSIRFGGWTMMADADDQDDDADDGDDDPDDDDDDDDDDDADDKGKKPTAEQKRIEELAAENKRRRLKAAKQDKELKELQAQIQKLSGSKPSDKKDDDKADDKSDESTAKVTELETKLAEKDRLAEDLLIRLEFSTNTKHSWKNPKAALKLLDLSEVTIGDDGEIEGLEDAIDALAKSDPYLLKDEDDEDEDDKDKRKQTKTGQRSGGGRQRKTGVPNRDKLVAKYPALRR